MLPLETAIGTNGLVNTLSLKAETGTIPNFSELVPGFARYAQFELALSAKTAKKYQECLNWIVKDLATCRLKFWIWGM